MGNYYGWLLAVILVLVSGLIAYLGDILGRRMGRRRITLFNLRPRHTAILISVVAGMLITIVTLTAAAMLSEQVRIGFTRVGQMQEQLKDLEKMASLSRKTAEKAKAGSRKAQEEKQAALQELSGTKQRAEVVRTSLAAFQKKLTDTTTKLSEVRGRLQQSQGRLAAAKKQYDAVSAKYQETSQSLKRGETKAFELGRKSLTMESQMNDLARQKEALATEVATLQKQESTLTSEKGRLQEEVNRLSGIARIATPALTEATVFEVGHEVGRRQFAAEQPIAGLRDQLEQFVGELAATAENAGAGKTEDGRSIVPVGRFGGQDQGPLQIYEGSELLELLARQIHSAEGNVIVRAFSVLNVPRGQPVWVEFSLTQNQLLFKKGEKLGELTVDPKKPEAQLLIELVWWLREQVAQRAREANILPDLAPGNENNLLFGPTRFPVGRISPDRLFELLKAIKKYSRPVPIVARAGEDTWTAGPLQLELAPAER
jgi:uncharacterized protein (DUF3084 family)